MDARELATLSRLLDEALDLHPDAREPWVAALDDEYEPMKPRLRIFPASTSGGKS